jgi:glycosyltransferase involved in cell wall biosynthesis
LKFSIVTISFNQAQFLERAIVSVLGQQAQNLEYIVVDPGSTDGSREIIERYREKLAHIVFDKDDGPADGLNKGFMRASGDIFCCLNSDDEFEPGAFAHIESYFNSRPQVDVVCGHAYIIDADGRRLRRVWSDPYNHTLVAYGAAIQIQPSTFIRAKAFRQVGGFNVKNRISWDGELLVDLALAGARIEVINQFLSAFRLHKGSITGAALHRELTLEQNLIRFSRLMGRPRTPRDRFISSLFFLVRQVRNPRAFLERVTKGGVYGRISGG